MKQLVILLFLALSHPDMMAQTYFPMAMDSAMWYMASTDENPQFDERIVVRLEGDTVVNNLSYSKIYHYTDNQNGVVLNSRKIIGLLRDDIAERKVYGGLLNGEHKEFETFLNQDAQCDWGETNTFNEHLLYDFDVQAGDTISSCMLTSPAVITEIDVIDRHDYLRRTLILDDGTIMTEGIGTCIGIFKGSDCFFTGGGYAYSLFDYCVGPFSNCNLLTATKKTQDLNQITISPNPTSDILLISSWSNLEKISIFNLQGRLIDSFSDMNRIDMKSYEPGLYIIHIQDSNGESYSQVISKI